LLCRNPESLDHLFWSGSLILDPFMRECRPRQSRERAHRAAIEEDDARHIIPISAVLIFERLLLPVRPGRWNGRYAAFTVVGRFAVCR